MDIPRIVSLDLRSLERTRIEWDWPTPPRVSNPRRITIQIAVDTTKFYAELDRAIASTKRLNAVFAESRVRKPVRQWYWYRISFALGTLLLAVQAAWLLAVAWL